MRAASGSWSTETTSLMFWTSMETWICSCFHITLSQIRLIISAAPLFKTCTPGLGAYNILTSSSMCILPSSSSWLILCGNVSNYLQAAYNFFFLPALCSLTGCIPFPSSSSFTSVAFLLSRFASLPSLFCFLFISLFSFLLLDRYGLRSLFRGAFSVSS